MNVVLLIYIVYDKCLRAGIGGWWVSVSERVVVD